MLWLNMLLQESVDMESNALMVWRRIAWLKVKERQGAEGIWTLKGAFLCYCWHKMVAMCHFVWPPGLRLWSVSEWVSETLGFSDFEKFYTWLPESDFLFLILHVFHVRWTYHSAKWYSSHLMFKVIFKSWWCLSLLRQSLLKRCYVLWLCCSS